MLWFKFSILFLTANIAFAQNFTSKECLDSKFSNHIINDGQLFGLIKNDLRINKDGCQVEVYFKKVLKTRWLVDLCREPIHIKVTSKGSQEVYKLNDDCKKDSEDAYCKNKDELLTVIQDYGLIYAQGERELLNTNHGQTFCTFLLLKKYLNEAVLFSKYDTPINIFEKSTESCPIPDQKEKASTSLNSKNEAQVKKEINVIPAPQVEEPSTEAEF